MSLNVSSSVRIHTCGMLQVCPSIPEDDVCATRGVVLASLLLNAVAIIIILLHILLLTRLQSLQDMNTYRMVLQHIAAADLLSAMSLVVRDNCALRLHMLGKPLVSAAMLSIATDIAPTFRLYILALSAYERYLAVCQPYGHNEHFIIKYSRLSIGAVWIVAMLLVMTRDLIFHEHLCVHPVLGPTMLKDFGVLSINCISTFICWLVITVSLAKLCQELKILKQRRVKTWKDKRNIASAHYVIIICGLYSIDMIPLALTLLMYFCSTHQPIVNGMAGDIFSLYGLVNSVVYGIMTRNYLIEMRQFLCFNRRQIAPLSHSTRINVIGAESSYNLNVIRN